MMDVLLFFSQRRGFFPAVFFWLTTCYVLEAQTASGPVVFCSYNLKNWLQSRPPFAEKDAPLTSKPEKEKTKVVEHLLAIRPDILGVCEIGTREDLIELQSRLREGGLELPYVEHCRGCDATRSLGLLSRFAITERASQTQLEYQMGALTYPMQRGILDATLEITPSFKVRFLGVHLKSKRAIPGADEALMRRNEAHLLRQHMDTLFAQQPDARVVCYGDFNDHRNEPAIGAIMGSRSAPGQMSDLPLRDAHGLVWTHFWDEADVYGRLDYIFVSRSLRPAVVAKGSGIFTRADFYEASDHRPLYMTLRPPTQKPPVSNAEK